MGAATSAVTVVSGLVGLNQQNESAKAQKKALASQQEQQTLQAQLQYMSLKNQSYSAQVSDYISDATDKLTYQQQQLKNQTEKASNDIAIQNALFNASIKKTSAGVQEQASNLAADKQQSEANTASNQQLLSSLGSALEGSQGANKSILDMLREGENQQNTISNLLDMAAASGGVNEALDLLLSSDDANSTYASGRFGRSNQLEQTKNQLARNISASSESLAAADNQSNKRSNALTKATTEAEAEDATIDANYSKQLADSSFEATNAANEASYNIGVISNHSSRYSRDYLQQANEEALLKGATISNDILESQKSSVKTPGLFDYIGVGVSGYNSYQQNK